MDKDINLLNYIDFKLRKKDSKCTRLLGNIKLLRDVNLIKWTSCEREKYKDISINPLKQNHPPVFCKNPFSTAKAVQSEVWDGDLNKTEVLLEKNAECLQHCPEIRLRPLAAVNKQYEDPYSVFHAETKVLAGKGVNFFLISRSFVFSKKLAQKISFEMNSVLVDPMQILENHYHSKLKGFYIPPKLDVEMKHFINRHCYSEFCTVLPMLKSMFYYFKQCPEGIICGFDKRGIKPYSKLDQGNLLRKTENKEKLLINQTDESYYMPEKDINFYEASSTKTSKSCQLQSRQNLNVIAEYLSTRCMETLVCALCDLSAGEANEVLDSIFSEEFTLLDGIDLSPYKQALARSYSVKNYSWARSVLSEECTGIVEGFDAYTRGYVMAYDGHISEINEDFWDCIFSSLNPPDVIVHGQCTIDEAHCISDSMRLNPFIPFEYCHSGMMENVYNCQPLHYLINGVDIFDLQELHISNSLSIEEAEILEFSETIGRRNLLCNISEFCRSLKNKSNKVGEDFKQFGESNTSKQDLIFNEVVLQIENYVQMPKEMIYFIPRTAKSFNVDFLLMKYNLNCHSSCMIRTDVRIPLCYQLSVIRSWFDYSGYYSKPRAICGSPANMSFVCEVIAAAIERKNLIEEFMIEYNIKLKLDKSPLGEGSMLEGEEEHTENDASPKNRLLKDGPSMEPDENIESEVGLEMSVKDFTVEPSKLTSSSFRSIIEFERTRSSTHFDEFFYLRQSFESRISYLADLQLLNSRYAPAFFHTFQCYFTVWEDRCPVAHYEGKCRRGRLENAVRLHDRGYMLSTLQAMKAFMQEPSKYLLPLLPASQCSVLVTGGVQPAQKYLAEALAVYFGATVIDYISIVNNAKEEVKNTYLEATTVNIMPLIQRVFCENLSPFYKEECDKLSNWLHKAYQLIIFRKLIFKPLFWDLFPPEHYDADESMYSISEIYNPLDSKFDIQKICRRAQVRDVVMEVFFNTFQKYSDYMNIEPFFLIDCPEDVLNYDILLDTLLREQYKNVGLLDIYGSYDICDFYAWYPYRLLERLPIDLLPRNELHFAHDNLKNNEELGKFLFPLETVPLSVKEKMDILGTEIIRIENEARFSGQLSYGGWIIDGMPTNSKLFRGLEYNGIFPRNLLYIDNPENLSLKQPDFNFSRTPRLSDIEKILNYFVFNKLRGNEFSMAGKQANICRNGLSKIFRKIMKRENMPNIGAKIARAHAKLRAFVRVYHFQEHLDNIEDWPGQNGLRHSVERNQLFERITLDPNYDRTADLEGLYGSLGLLQLTYELHGSRQFRPIRSLTAMHTAIAKTYRSYLYGSLKFRNKKSQPDRVAELMHLFFFPVKKDIFFSECLKLVSFKFPQELMNNCLSPLKGNQFKTDLSYLYHLAYALENSMLMSNKLNSVLKRIYLFLHSLGYSCGPYENCQPKAIQVSRTFWEEREKNRALLYVEKKLKIYSNIIDYEYIVHRILELEKKRCKRISLPSRESYKDKTLTEPKNILKKTIKLPLPSMNSNLNKIQNMGINALRIIVEFDLNLVLLTDDIVSKFVLYFPQNNNFISDVEKAYNFTLTTTGIYHTTGVATIENASFSTLKVLLDEYSHDDWVFTRDEDHGNFSNFWSCPNAKLINNLLDLPPNNLEKISTINGFSFMQKIFSIQYRIDSLRRKKPGYCFTDEEKLLLNYMVWLRNEYFKRYYIGVINFPGEAYSEDMALNLTKWIPHCSNFCHKYLSFKDKKSIRTLTNFCDIWPFRRNCDLLPKFLGIYNSVLWSEISLIRKNRPKSSSKDKYVVESPIEDRPSLHNVASMKPSVQMNDFINPFVDFMLRSLCFIPNKSLDKERRKFKTDINIPLFKVENFDGILSASQATHHKSNEYIFLKNDFITNYNNDNSRFSKDGQKRPGLLYKNLHQNEKSKVVENIEELKSFLLDSNVISKITWHSIDEFGSFNLLYSTLYNIKGSRGLTKVTGTSLPPEKENLPDNMGGEGSFYPKENLKEPVPKLRGEKEKICAVSILDGNFHYGYDGLSLQLSGKLYYFCSLGCLTRFRLTPSRFVNIMEPLENYCPFNVFYIELPGGIGRNICSILCYYFEISAFYMDDYFVQRFKTKNTDSDIRTILLKKKLITCFANERSKQAEDNEKILWLYLVQESGVPSLIHIIEKWKNNNKVCVYNFPHHPNNLRDTIIKCFIPHVILKTDLNSLKKSLELKNLDLIKNFAGDIYDDKNRITKQYFLSFKWWMMNWQRRFVKTLMTIKREEMSKIITLMQFNLHQLKNMKQQTSLIMKPLEFEEITVWSNTTFPFSEWPKNSNTAIFEKPVISLPVKLDSSYRENSKINGSFDSLSFCDESQGKICAKKWGDMVVNDICKEEYYSMVLKSHRFQLPRQSRWKCDYKLNFDFEAAKKISDNRREIKRICLNIKKQFQRDINNEMTFRKNIKETICAKKSFADDEAKLKNEVLSADSVGFEDYSHFNIDNEDLKNDNAAGLLKITLKHTNTLNPIPTPILDKFYEFPTSRDLNIFTRCQLQSHESTHQQIQNSLDCAISKEMDVISESLPKVIDHVKYSRKRVPYSECVAELDKENVEQLLDTGYYFLSKFGRQCPVQSRLGISYPYLRRKILYDSSNFHPVVHRRYIYFLSSEKALEEFKYNPLEFINQADYMPLSHIRAIFFGPNTKRMKYVLTYLAKEYSLEHISVSKALEHFVRKSTWSSLSQRLKSHISYVYGLPCPTKIPCSLIWEAVITFTSSQRSTTHGFIISGLYPSRDLFEIWRQSNFIPHMVFLMTLDKPVSLSNDENRGISNNLHSMGLKTKHLAFSKKSFLMNELVGSIKGLNGWDRKTNIDCIAYLRKTYHNVHVLCYDSNYFTSIYDLAFKMEGQHKNLRIMYELQINENSDPLPLGNFISYKTFSSTKDYCWGSMCPVCICISGRNLHKYSQYFQRGVFFLKEKGYCICREHSFEFLLSWGDYTTPFGLRLHLTSEEFNKFKRFRNTPYGYKGFCAVCYILHEPHLEYQYRCGSSNYLQLYDNEAYKLCSKFCLDEFISSPWFYVLLRKCKILPYIDTKYWSGSDLKVLSDNYLLVKDIKDIFVYNMIRLATFLNMMYPGLSKRETRIFFIYILAKRYMSVREMAEDWKYVLLNFLRQSGMSEGILQRFLRWEDSNDIELHDLIELFASRMTK